MSAHTTVAGSETELLHRPRLLRRLHGHRHRTLTLVVAPTGFGKTTLLRDFSRGAPFPVCSLSLSPAHADAATFVELLLAALGQHVPEFDRATCWTPRCARSQQRDLPALAHSIAHNLMACAPDPLVLVLDDYHTLDDHLEISLFLEHFLLAQPDHCHTIVSSRVAPGGLPLIQLVAQGQAGGVGPGHLAFTPAEVQAVLAQRYNLALSLAQAEEIVAESGGWIAGILLAAGAMWQGIRDSLAQTQIRTALPELALSPLGESDALFGQAWQTLSRKVQAEETAGEGGGAPCSSIIPIAQEVRPSGPGQEISPRLGPGVRSKTDPDRDADGDAVLQVGDLVIDVPRRSVKRGDRTMVLITPPGPTIPVGG